MHLKDTGFPAGVVSYHSDGFNSSRAYSLGGSCVRMLASEIVLVCANDGRVSDAVCSYSDESAASLDLSNVCEELSIIDSDLDSGCVDG